MVDQNGNEGDISLVKLSTNVLSRALELYFFSLIEAHVFLSFELISRPVAVSNGSRFS